MKYIVVFLPLVLFYFNINLFSQDNAVPADKKEKKIRYEISLGIARVNPASIYKRNSGINELIGQYAQHYQLDYSSNGKFSESKLFIPFNVSANYKLNDKLYLKAGFDYSTGSVSPQKTFQVDWGDFYEEYDYGLSGKVSCLMPYIGVGYRRVFFDFYGMLGLGFTSFTHTENLDYSESQPGNSVDTTHTFKVNGTAPGIIIGAKYKPKVLKKIFSKNIKPFVKLEIVLLKVSSLSGSKTTVSSSSGGGRDTLTREGDLYEFQWNPYAAQRFETWDLYETLPSDSTMQNFEKMGLNLSGIRLMIGISF